MSGAKSADGVGGTGADARCFVLTVPGLGELVASELSGVAGVEVTGTGNDGRADVVTCQAAPDALRALLLIRSVEDVFVEVGRTLRAEGDRPPWIAKRLWKPNRAARVVGLWRRLGDRPGDRPGNQPGDRPGRRGSGGSGGRKGGGEWRGGTTFRAVVRVLSERSFHRTELRRAMETAVGRAEPAWQRADPAALEIWVVEYAAGKFVAGLRLTSSATRQHGGREVERSGALRPAVAAAMLGLAGARESDGESTGRAGGSARLLDPCCGSGTILAEALAGGWRADGLDIDPAAVRAARRNAPRATIDVGDARALGFEAGTFDAVVSNLPFGRQYGVDGDPDAWSATVLGELARATRPGGRVVLLAPKLPRQVQPAELRLDRRHRLRLLGTPTALWVFDRR